MKKALLLFLLIFSPSYPGIPKGSMIGVRSNASGFKPVQQLNIFDRVITFEFNKPDSSQPVDTSAVNTSVVDTSAEDTSAEDLGYFTETHIKSLLKFRSRNIMIISTSSGILCCCRESRLFCVNRNKFVRVTDLTKEDVLLSNELKPYPILSIVDFKTTGAPVTFFVLSLDRNFNYFQTDSAGTGFLFHNVHPIVFYWFYDVFKEAPALIETAPVFIAAGALVVKGLVSNFFDGNSSGGRSETRNNDKKREEYFRNLGIPDLPEDYEATRGMDDQQKSYYFASLRRNLRQVCDDGDLEMSDKCEAMLNEGKDYNDIVDEIKKIRRRNRARAKKEEQRTKNQQKNKERKEAEKKQKKKDRETKAKNKSSKEKLEAKINKEVLEIAGKNLHDSRVTDTSVTDTSVTGTSVTGTSVTTTTTTTTANTCALNGIIPKMGEVSMVGNIVVDKMNKPEEKFDTTGLRSESIPESKQEIHALPIDLPSAVFLDSESDDGKTLRNSSMLSGREEISHYDINSKALPGYKPIPNTGFFGSIRDFFAKENEEVIDHNTWLSKVEAKRLESIRIDRLPEDERKEVRRLEAEKIKEMERKKMEYDARQEELSRYIEEYEYLASTGQIYQYESDSDDECSEDECSPWERHYLEERDRRRDSYFMTDRDRHALRQAEHYRNSSRYGISPEMISRDASRQYFMGQTRARTLEQMVESNKLRRNSVPKKIKLDSNDEAKLSKMKKRE